MSEQIDPIIVTGINGVSRRVFQSGETGEAVCREGSGLCVIESGSAVFRERGVESVCGADSVLLIPQGAARRVTFRERTSVLAVCFSAQGLPAQPYRMPLSSKELVLSELDHMTEQAAGRQADAYALMASFYLILSYLTRPANGNVERKSAVNAAVSGPSVAYLNRNYNKPSLTLDEIAVQSNISTAYFRSLFSAAYGISPIKYATELRIALAKRLLRQNTMTVKDVSFECGYSNTSRFSTAFRKAVGVSPTAYMNQFRKAPSPEPDPPTNRFPDGSRVCFIGDSLTAQNVFLPRIIEQYKENFPNAGIRFYNCGVSGGTAKAALDFLDDLTLCHNPTHIVIACGINDSAFGRLNLAEDSARNAALTAAYDGYIKNLTALCGRIRSLGIELILCTPAPYAEFLHAESEPVRGGASLLSTYAEFVRTLADSLGTPLCDYHRYLTEALADDAEGKLYMPDRVHPTPHGYYRMAECFLRFQGLEIGEEKPLPAYFSRWDQKLWELLYGIFAVENMVIRDYSLPLEEKLAFVRGYIAQNRFPEMPKGFFERIARAYLVNKPRQKEIMEEIGQIYDRDIL